MDYRVVVCGKNESYQVGIYDCTEGVVFDSYSGQNNFPQVITKLTSLALKHPEAFNQIDITTDDSQKTDAIRGLQKLVKQSIVSVD